MAQLDIRILGVDRLRRKLTPKLYREPLQDAIQTATLLAEREARQNVSKDTSALARSIASTVKPLEGRVSSPLVYALPVEEGRRPGGRMPPPAALEGWARRHGYTGSLFVLARSIARRGIKGRFFMKRAAQAVTNALPGIMAQVGRDIEVRWRR